MAKRDLIISKVFDLPVPTLTYGVFHSLGSDQKNEVADTSNGSEFPVKGGWALPYR